MFVFSNFIISGVPNLTAKENVELAAEIVCPKMQRSSLRAVGFDTVLISAHYLWWEQQRVYCSPCGLPKTETPFTFGDEPISWSAFDHHTGKQVLFKWARYVAYLRATVIALSHNSAPADWWPRDAVCMTHAWRKSNVTQIHKIFKRLNIRRGADSEKKTLNKDIRNSPLRQSKGRFPLRLCSLMISLQFHRWVIVGPTLKIPWIAIWKPRQRCRFIRMAGYGLSGVKHQIKQENDVELAILPWYG